MYKLGKWALTLGLIAASPSFTSLAIAQSKDAKPSVKASTKSHNQQMADKVAAALRAEKFSGYDVGIEFQDGVVTLKGMVSDRKQKPRATEIAKRVPGVTNVDNQLALAPKKSVAEALLPPNDRVTHAGHTGSAKEGKIQQVNGEVTPQSTLQNNQDVANQIGAALSSAHLDGYDIEIRYQNGVAMLEGKVPTNAQRAQAAQIAERVPGVRSVANRLQVTEEQQLPDRPAMAQQTGYPPQMGYNPQMGMMPPQGGPDPRLAMMPPQGGPDPRLAMMANGVDPRMIPAAYQGAPPGMGGAAVPPPAPYGHPGAGMTPASYNMPNMPDYAWPAYAQYPNSAAVSYPQQYSASAWPYIGPFYPYPQVPLGWRDATLRWDDGQWNLQFRQRTDKWWWFLHPKNWD